MPIDRYLSGLWRWCSESLVSDPIPYTYLSTVIWWLSIDWLPTFSLWRTLELHLDHEGRKISAIYSLFLFLDNISHLDWIPDRMFLVKERKRDIESMTEILQSIDCLLLPYSTVPVNLHWLSPRLPSLYRIPDAPLRNQGKYLDYSWIGIRSKIS